MREYPLTNIEGKFNNQLVKNIGVFHTIKFFNQHSYFFLDSLKDVQAIVLEQICDSEVFKSYSFFNDIGEIAQRRNLPIYVADPVNKVLYGADIATGIAGMVLVDQSVSSSLRLVKKRNQDMSRREFLKGLAIKAGVASVGLNLIASGLPGNFLKGLISDDLTTEYGAEDTVSYGALVDYRNVMIAEGVDKITKIQKGPIVMIHGEGHAKTSQYYLQHPNWRKLKKFLYLPYQLMSRTKVRKWEFNKKDRKWKLTDLF